MLRSTRARLPFTKMWSVPPAAGNVEFGGMRRWLLGSDRCAVQFATCSRNGIIASGGVAAELAALPLVTALALLPAAAAAAGSTHMHSCSVIASSRGRHIARRSVTDGGGGVNCKACRRAAAQPTLGTSSPSDLP